MSFWILIAASFHVLEYVVILYFFEITITFGLPFTFLPFLQLVMFHNCWTV